MAAHWSPSNAAPVVVGVRSGGAEVLGPPQLQRARVTAPSAQPPNVPPVTLRSNITGDCSRRFGGLGAAGRSPCAAGSFAEKSRCPGRSASRRDDVVRRCVRRRDPVDPAAYVHNDARGQLGDSKISPEYVASVDQEWRFRAPRPKRSAGIVGAFTISEHGDEHKACSERFERTPLREQFWEFLGAWFARRCKGVDHCQLGLGLRNRDQSTAVGGQLEAHSSAERCALGGPRRRRAAAGDEARQKEVAR